MKKTCPIYHVAGFIGKRWTLLILTELHKGRKKWKRYSEIKRKLPEITPKMLSARLKEMGREGLLKRRLDASSFPVKSEYRLTPKGEDFIGIVRYMRDWALKWKVRNAFCETVDCEDCEI